MNTTPKSLNVSFPSDTEVLMTRTLKAPRPLAYECFTKCELLAKWWGQPGPTLTHCEMDLRVGGQWKRTLLLPGGQEMPFEGEYKEVVPNERLSYTLIMPSTPALLETIALEDENDATKLSVLVKFPNQQMRDGMAPYMEPGASAAYEQLSNLLETLQ